jgi:hypothetical protein
MTWQLAWFLAVALWAQVLSGVIVYTTLSHGLPPIDVLALRLLTWFTLPATALFLVGVLSGPAARAIRRRSWFTARPAHPTARSH